MAKGQEDIHGTYAANDDCIGCAICSEIAPANFRFDHDQGRGYVCKQPGTGTEERLCTEAMDICPASAIEVAGTS